jgi:Transposase, Mutator family
MDAVDEQLVARLVEQARSRGIGLMGPDGLLQQVTKHVLTEIKNRGVGDVCIVVCDGLQGMPDAIATVGWPRSPRRASCTCCATASATPPGGTGPSSPRTSGPSSEAQVIPLLSASPTCGALVTSRAPLSGLGGVQLVALDVLP